MFWLAREFFLAFFVAVLKNYFWKKIFMRFSPENIEMLNLKRFYICFEMFSRACYDDLLEKLFSAIDLFLYHFFCIVATVGFRHKKCLFICLLSC